MVWRAPSRPRRRQGHHRRRSLSLRSESSDLHQRLRRRRADAAGNSQQRHDERRFLHRHAAGPARGVQRPSRPPASTTSPSGPTTSSSSSACCCSAAACRRLLTIVTAFTHRPQRHAGAGDAADRRPAGAHHRAGHCAQHRLCRRRQPAGGRKGRDVRAWVALAFGLVHGFGFASVLRETRPARPRARRLALLLQPRRRDRPGHHRRRRRLGAGGRRPQNAGAGPADRDGRVGRRHAGRGLLVLRASLLRPADVEACSDSPCGSGGNCRDGGRPAETRAVSGREATIAQIHAAMKAGPLTCRGLVEQYLQRIERSTSAGRRSTPSS